MSSDVLIIGAGVSGLLSALCLSRAGLRVTLVERGPVAGESTWAGAGILSPLPPWDYGPEVNALSERGRNLWPEWIAYLLEHSPVDPEYLTSGMLVLGLADMAAASDWCEAHGWFREEPPAALSGFMTDVDDTIWLPGVAQVRNPRLGQALMHACQAAGVGILRDTPAQTLGIRENRVAGIHTPDGLLTADSYVVSAGAWSRELLGEQALGLDIQPVRGQILLFKGTPGIVPSIIFKGGRYLVPRKDGRVLVGSTLEYAGFDKSVTEEAKEALSAFALETAPGLASAEVVGHWAGLRPGSPGNIPSVDRHPVLDNLYLNSGQFRYGVTMAPACAELLRDLILGRRPRLDPTPYRWPVT